MNTKELGNLTELQVITELYALGVDVSLPFGNSQKYDLIADYNGQLKKIQIKHSAPSYEGDSLIFIEFKTRWQGHNASGYTQNYYTKEDIDYFATFFGQKVYLVPVEECSGATKRLRFAPPKSGQKIGINFAEQYLAEEVIQKW